MSDTTPPEALPSERRIIAAVWPTLLASAAGLLPFTIFTTYLVPIAEAVGDGHAEVGSMRGLAGIGAVLTGIALAPLIGRIAPGRVAAASLVLLGIAALIGTAAWIPALAAFCLLTGVSNALLYPALSSAAADRFGTGPAASRGAALVMTSQTLASTLGAPLLIIPTLWWGWQGDLVAIAVIAFLLAPILYRFGRDEHADNAPRLGYIAAFRTLAAVPGAVPLLTVSFARAGAFMGHLAFLAPLYGDRFGLTSSMFAFVWSLSGGSFFLGHLISGRMVNLDESDRRAQRVMTISLLTALIAMIGVYTAPVLPLALICTAILSASHAVVSAAVVTLLVRRCTDVRGTALSLNSAGMSLGLFLGAAASGTAMSTAGYQGAVIALSAMTVAGLVAAMTLKNRTP
ncbi:Predicted arabinose efflux permease, MFS family [Austwickia chelonae]|uniref:Putative major facilitator superfamily transporter n=1 Tax=Austwickia chelonae NBRC 105200 TaxID=1184607 RepID=K6VAL4_9MICO|nr:MFS transporter [Austwickia chelonae]GAB79288.1 putative major facilitator superfamily transporter [Austwickia chelonae NBRC 105200]SEW37946.1 Predicted arabinose efflux permease, MFS family [Austwickia chelonae]